MFLQATGREDSSVEEVCLGLSHVLGGTKMDELLEDVDAGKGINGLCDSLAEARL